jgi:hypothetical protein
MDDKLNCFEAGFLFVLILLLGAVIGGLLVQEISVNHACQDLGYSGEFGLAGCQMICDDGSGGVVATFDVPWAEIPGTDAAQLCAESE